MNSVPRSRAQELYEQLRNLSPAECNAFLHERCRDEPSVIAEVIQLFNARDQPTVQGTDLETEVISKHAAGHQQAFVKDEILAGRFLILRFISSGGMGEVYAAEDQKLGGEVAIKTIRYDIASDPLIIERFRQEISISRRITHPNVCRVFDLESHRGHSREIVFLTMELLEGESMARWMDREGPISTHDAAPIVLQILEGLSAAHRAGVVHQDFKPSNVFLVPEGNGRRAVVMDFGLARPVILSSQADGAVSRKAFGGTPMYMAPEQLEGEEGSVASDIYSVGLVLYELVTGRKPFNTETSDRPGLPRRKELPPSPKQYLPNLDECWERVILACLSPDAKRRPQSMDAVIEDLGYDASRSIFHPVGGALTWRPAVIALVCALAIFVTYWLANRPGETIRNLTRLTSETDLSSGPALSRDGKVIAYTSDRGEPGNQDIWIQTLPGGEPKRITRDSAQEYDTDLSPDGSQVAFRSDRGMGGIYIADATRGHERLLVPYGRKPRFAPDGKTIAFWTGEFDNSIPSGRIYVIPAAGGSAQQLVPEFADAREPLWSPEGRSILFTGCREFSGSLDNCQEWWVKRLDSGGSIASGVLASLRSSRIEPFLDAGGWYRDGVLFPAFDGSETNIWRVKISARSSLMTGKPQRLTSPGMRTVNPTLAENGTVAFGQLSGAIHVWQVRPDGDQSSQPSKLTNGPDVDSSPSVSRDGRLLVFVRGRKPQSIWLKELESGRESPLFRSSDDQLRPLISPTGSQIAFVTRGRTGNTIQVARPGGEAKQVCSGCENPTGWFAGDRALLITDGRTAQIAMVNVPDGKRTTVLSRNGVALGDATWSVEAQYLLFTETRNDGQRQIFAVRFPAFSGAAEGRWIPITNMTEWCDKPQWSADGETVYYLSKRDSFLCIWGQRFDPKRGRNLGTPFPVTHFHNPRWTPELLLRHDLGFSVSALSIILNVGEASETIWLGTLGTRPFFSFSR
jgi:serine/threonine protein kinase